MAVDTPIVQVQKPDEANFRRTILDINKKVDVIQAELKDVQESLNDLQKSNKGGGASDKKTELRNEVELVKDQMNKLDLDRKTCQAHIAEYKRMTQNFEKDLATKKNGLQFTSIEKAMGRIHELNDTLQKTNLSLQEEKATIREISLFKQKIPQIKASLKEVDSLEKKKPDFSAEVAEKQAELEKIRDETNELRKTRSQILDQLRALNDSEQGERTERNTMWDSLILKREKLADEQDEQTSLLLDAQSTFNAELTMFRQVEEAKKKISGDKLREKKNKERQTIERAELEEQIAACVVEDDGAEDDEGGQHLYQIYNYCIIQLDKLEEPKDTVAKSKRSPKNKTVDMQLLSAFADFGLSLPSSKEDYEACIKILEPKFEAQVAANEMITATVEARRAILVAKLEALDKQIALESSLGN